MDNESLFTQKTMSEAEEEEEQGQQEQQRGDEGGAIPIEMTRE